MKISWGTGIVLALLAFISFILYLVITMTTNKELDHDLVVEEYYKKEMDFQNQLDKQQNAQQLREDIRAETSEEGITVYFPTDLDIRDIGGRLSLYRPSNKQLDFSMELSLEGHELLIPKERLVEGRWNIEVDWTYGAESYYYQKDLTY